MYISRIQFTHIANSGLNRLVKRRSIRPTANLADLVNADETMFRGHLLCLRPHNAEALSDAFV